MALARVTSVQLRADRPPVLPPSLLTRSTAAGSDKADPSNEKSGSVAEPKRPKRKRMHSDSAGGGQKEQWLSLGGVPLDTGSVTQRAEETRVVDGAHGADSKPPLPRWPAALDSRGSELYSAMCRKSPDMVDAEAALRALRLSLAAGMEDLQWLDFLRGRLRGALAVLASTDEALATDVRVFEGSCAVRGRQRKVRGASAATAPAAVVQLIERAALDSIHFSLWELSRRRGQPCAHPAKLAVEVQEIILSAPGSSDAIRKILQPASLAATRQAWGLRGPWLRAVGKDGGRPWKENACSLLQVFRARWCEAVCLVSRVLAKSSTAAQLDVADKRTRRALLDWQFVGRDCGARWLAFAVPNPAALQGLADEGGEAGIAELGAGNGYWAGLLLKKKIAVTALDVTPPEIAPVGQASAVAVRRGTADDLPGLDHQALLLCMPPPGEEDCSAAALTQFSGSAVVYVGEWASGMTGTRSFHEELLQSFTLKERVPLPSWPQMRVEAFFFQRRAQALSRGKKRKAAVDESDPSPSPLACDVCGRLGTGPCGDVGLWRCPWSRQFRVCSKSCYESGEQAHMAVLQACFCGALVSQRPPLEVWQATNWLEFGEAGDGKRWAALKEATPQAEPRLLKRGMD